VQFHFVLQLVLNTLKILCTNSAWQRRKLGKMLQDWRVIYVQVCLIFVVKISCKLSYWSVFLFFILRYCGVVATVFLSGFSQKHPLNPTLLINIALPLVSCPVNFP
jgi:hypothetical protein